MLKLLSPNDEKLKKYIKKNLETIKSYSKLPEKRIGWNYSLDYSFVAMQFKYLDSLGLMNNNLKILDIGCGPGSIHGYLEDIYDINIRGIDMHRWKWGDYVDHTGNFLNENFRKKHNLKNFDIIISTSAFEHMKKEEHEKIIQLCKDSLIKGGYLIVTACMSETNRASNGQDNLTKEEVEKIYNAKFKDYDYKKTVKEWQNNKLLIEEYKKQKQKDKIEYLSFGYFYKKTNILPKITDYKNKYKGQRCFVLGNGPSLKDTNLELLKNEYTFGLNKIALIYEQTTWRPTFFVSFTDHVTKSKKDDGWKAWTIKSIDLKVPCFLNASYKKDERLKKRKNAYFTKCVGTMTTNWKDDKWSDDISKLITKWGTTLMCSLEIAVYMGFNPIYLIGCDLGFVDNKDLKNDQNHFDSRYFVPQKKASMYNHNMIEAHKFMKKIFDKKGIKVYNVTIGGELEIYERADYTSLFNKK